jgi:hypothetical protein
VADAAGDLVGDVLLNTDLSRGVATGDPNVAPLIASINAFRQAAVSFAGR